MAAAITIHGILTAWLSNRRPMTGEWLAKGGLPSGWSMISQCPCVTQIEWSVWCPCVIKIIVPYGAHVSPKLRGPCSPKL